MADSGTGAEKFKMSLEHLIGPESKEVFKKQKEQGMSHKSIWNNFQLPKLEQFRNKMNNAVLDL